MQIIQIIREALNNVGEADRARQKTAKKRSLHVVNEHFESFFNTALTTQVIIQRFLRTPQGIPTTPANNTVYAGLAGIRDPANQTVPNAVS